MKFEKTKLGTLLLCTTAQSVFSCRRLWTGRLRFALYGEGAEKENLSLQNTKMPPKELLFPATEKLYSWGSSGGQAFIETANAPVDPFVAFGVRPCDVAAIDVLDDVS